MLKQAGCDLQKNLWLSISSHRAEYRHKLAVTGCKCWRQGMRGTPTWPEDRWMAGLKGKPESSIVQIDLRVGFCKPASKPGCIRLDKRDRVPIGLCGTEICRISICRANTNLACRIDIEQVSPRCDGSEKFIAIGAIA
jgi:hypothetical protein